MRVLFFGDVVGTEATQLLAHHMDEWRAETKADVVVVNVENALVTQLENPQDSYGLNDELALTLLDAGVDVLTGGNHSWDKLAPEDVYQRENVLRPHNMIEPSPGRGVLTVGVNGQPLTIVNLIGNTALYPPLKARKALDVFEELTFPNGMCGPSLGVVGMGPEWYVRRVRGESKPGFTLAIGPIQIGAVVLDTEANTLERFLPDLA